jgi:hypothetical protein
MNKNAATAAISRKRARILTTCDRIAGDGKRIAIAVPVWKTGQKLPNCAIVRAGFRQDGGFVPND